MKKFLFLLLLFTTPVYAGQVVCADANGKITNYTDSGVPTTGCNYYSVGQNGVDQAKYDAIRVLFRTVQWKYIILRLGNPEEMTTAEKATADQAEVLATNTAETNRINGMDVTAKEVARAISALVQESSNYATLKANLTETKIKAKIRELSGL